MAKHTPPQPAPAAARGRPFQPGQVANPKGRPPGIPDRRTKYRDLIEARMPDLVARCLQMALQGDVQALRLCLERVLPPLRAGDERVDLGVAEDASYVTRARAVLDAAMTGNLSAAGATALMGAVGEAQRVQEAEDLAERVARLEAWAAKEPRRG